MELIENLLQLLVTHTPSKNAKSPMTMYPKAAPPPYMLAVVSKPE